VAALETSGTHFAVAIAEVDGGNGTSLALSMVAAIRIEDCCPELDGNSPALYRVYSTVRGLNPII
jgi:hypothetical protein